MDPQEARSGDRAARILAVGSAEWHEQIRSALTDPAIDLHELKTGHDALERLAGAEPPDVMVLDAELPDMSGLALCREIRESSGSPDLPIVMVSHLSGEMDRVLAFENGVDDFLPCPFYERELASRLHAVVRRDTRRSASQTVVDASHFGPLAIDLERTRVELDGQRIDLTSREFEVLRALVENEGRVLERSRLAGDGDAGANPRVVDTHVKSLRRKLGRVRRCIETVRGVGYRFSGDTLRGS